MVNACGLSNPSSVAVKLATFVAGLVVTLGALGVTVAVAVGVGVGVRVAVGVGVGVRVAVGVGVGVWVAVGVGVAVAVGVGVGEGSCTSMHRCRSDHSQREESPAHADRRKAAE